MVFSKKIMLFAVLSGFALVQAGHDTSKLKERKRAFLEKLLENSDVSARVNTAAEIYGNARNQEEQDDAAIDLVAELYDQYDELYAMLPLFEIQDQLQAQEMLAGIEKRVDELGYGLPADIIRNRKRDELIKEYRNFSLS